VRVPPRDLLLLSLVVVSTYTAEGIVELAMPPYLAARGSEELAIGVVLAATYVAAFLVRVPAGLLYSERRASALVAGASLVVSAATLAYGLAPDLVTLVFLRLVHGAFFSGVTTLNMAQFFDARPSDYGRGATMGLMSAALALGYTFGNAIGGWWAELFGFPATFALAAVFPILAAVANSKVATPTPRAAPADRPVGLRAGLRAARRPGILLAAMLLFSLNFLNQMYGPFFNLYALGIGLSLTTIGLMRSVSSLAAVGTRLGAWVWSNALPPDAMSRLAITVSAVLIAVTPLSTSIPILLVLATAVAMLRSVVTITGSMSVMEATDATPEQRGVASAVFNMGKDVGSMSGPLFGGLVAQIAGIPTMMTVLPVATLALFWTITLATLPALRRERARTAGIVAE